MKKILFTILFLFSMNVSASSIIEAGDTVRISVYGNPDLKSETKVSSTGSIDFPLLGEVSIAGKSVEEVEKSLSSRLTGDGFLRKAKVSVVILQSVNNQISVLGNVGKPGKYLIEPGSEYLIEVLASAGGKVGTGSDVVTIIQMSGDTPKRVSVNIDKLLMESNVQQITKANIKLKGGDIVYVSEAPVFYIDGSINRAGAYPIKNDMTLAQAIALAGGISLRGTSRGIEVTRFDGNGTQLLSGEMNMLMQPNDVVYIKESLF